MIFLFHPSTVWQLLLIFLQRRQALRRTSPLNCFSSPEVSHSNIPEQRNVRARPLDAQEKRGERNRKRKTHKIKTVRVALQLPPPARRAVLPAQLLGDKQAVVPRDAFYPRSGPALRLERDDLIHVQPVFVVQVLEVAVEACVQEARVEGLEADEDARQQAFEREGWWG